MVPVLTAVAGFLLIDCVVQWPPDTYDFIGAFARAMGRGLVGAAMLGIGLTRAISYIFAG